MIEWFTKEAGWPGSAQSDEDPHMVIVGNVTPDWVRLPHDLGGTRQRVVGVGRGPCVCRQSHNVQHLKLDNGILVAECDLRAEYLWYRPREDAKDESTLGRCQGTEEP